MKYTPVIRNVSLTTAMAIAASMLAFANTWLGLALGICAAWVHSRLPQSPGESSRWLSKHPSAWTAAPVLAALYAVASGAAVPPDDLLRHLSAWQLGLDYRAQYPWSDLPRENLWLGFDYLLGALQRVGLPKDALLHLVPALSFCVAVLVLQAGLSRAVPTRRHRADLMLVCGIVALGAITPRMLLGRPEAFMTVLGAAAWLCKTRPAMVAWIGAYLVCIPAYWLGWTIAPFALLLPLAWRYRFALAAGLALTHLLFWQAYTGDYLGLMVWLRSTLSVPASENAPLHSSLGTVYGWALVLAVSWCAAVKLRHGLRMPKKERDELVAVGLLLVWFSLPNQIRYAPSLFFVATPWVYRCMTSVAPAHRLRTLPVPVLGCLLMLGAALQLPKFEPQAPFALPADAKVFSESPFSTVYYSRPGIAVEPSYAFGATKPAWRALIKEGKADCPRLKSGGFTHVIESSLIEIPSCLTLSQVHENWRLWEVAR